MENKCFWGNTVTSFKRILDGFGRDLGKGVYR